MAKKATKSTRTPLETYLLLGTQGATATITALLASLALATATAASVSLGQVIATVSNNSLRLGETTEYRWFEMYLSTIQQATIIFGLITAVLLFIGLKTLKNRPGNVTWTVIVGSVTATAVLVSYLAESVILELISRSQ